MTDVGPYVVSDVVAIICFLINVYFVSRTLYSLSIVEVRDPTNKPMATLSAAAIILFMLHQVLSIIDYSYSAATGKENEALSISGALYILGRLFVYGIFIYRLNYVIQGTFNPYPQRVISAVYSCLMIIIAFIIVLLIGFVGKILPLVFIGGFGFFIFDVILCVTLPLLFCGKLYQIIEFKESMNNLDDKDNNKINDKKPTHSQVDTSIELGSAGKVELSVPSIPSIKQIGATTENAPVNANKNKFKQDTILFTAGKISLLSCITLASMIVVLPIGIGLQGSGNNTWAGTIPEIVIKIDEVINVVCICLCFKINDEWYLKLCSFGHNTCENRPCYSCWKCCCQRCVRCCLE